MSNKTTVELPTFLTACAKGLKTVVKALIKSGIDINQKYNGESPLLVAARHGQTGVALFLMENGANLNEVDRGGENALMIAERNGHAHTVETLVERGYDMDAKNRSGDTSLMLAVRKWDVDLMNMMINFGANVNEKQNNTIEDTVLILAARDAPIAVVEKLVDMGANLNDHNTLGRTALMATVDKDIWPSYETKENNDKAEFLINRGADLNEKDRDGRTALMLAVVHRTRNTCEMLIGYGAHVNDKDNDGITPLLHALRTNKTDNIILLIENGADVTERDNHRNTTLMYAAKAENTDAILLLLEKGVGVDKKNDDGATALILASEEMVGKSVEVLLKAGANVNAKKHNGRTALMEAVFQKGRSFTYLVQLLIDHGGDVNGKDNDGNTVLELAIRAGHIENVRTLIEGGANIHEKVNGHGNALVLAILENKTDIVELLIKEGATDDVDEDVFMIDNAEPESSLDAVLSWSANREGTEGSVDNEHHEASMPVRDKGDETLNHIDKLITSGLADEECGKFKKKVLKNCEDALIEDVHKTDAKNMMNFFNTNWNTNTSSQADMKDKKSIKRQCKQLTFSMTKEIPNRNKVRNTGAKNQVNTCNHLRFEDKILRPVNFCKVSDNPKKKQSRFARDTIKTRNYFPVRKKITKETQVNELKLTTKTTRTRHKCKDEMLRYESGSSFSPTQYFAKTDLFKYIVQVGRKRWNPSQDQYVETSGKCWKPQAETPTLGSLRDRKTEIPSDMRHQKSRKPPDKRHLKSRKPPDIRHQKTRKPTDIRHPKSRTPPDRGRNKLCLVVERALKYWECRRTIGLFGKHANNCTEVNKMLGWSLDEKNFTDEDADAQPHRCLLSAVYDLLRAITQNSLETGGMQPTSHVLLTQKAVYLTLNVHKMERLTVQGSSCVNVTNTNFCVVD
ncbi:unnamed protein product [Lymnaea stagnalis]|uniref:Uncharacterized protein n=1 Tax=Lymnaea stagnalis TaxID=6523 RepID=A0AAV2HUU2_LYMST